MNINFKWIGGATFILTIENVKIAVDPVLCKKGTIQNYFWFKSKRLENPIFEKKDFENVDLWLITHNHKDHLDDEGIAKIKGLSKIVTNTNAYPKLKNKENVTVLKWGEKKVYSFLEIEITVEAIKAVHGINPISALFAGKVNGYYLTIKKDAETFNIYITSDTVYKQKIINTFAFKKIDLLIPNMGAAKKGSWIMTLTLDSKMLKKMLYKLKPKMVIPVHFGTFEHYVEPVREIEKISDKRIKILKVGETISL